jgi:hypothetical protein
MLPVTPSGIRAPAVDYPFGFRPGVCIPVAGLLSWSNRRSSSFPRFTHRELRAPCTDKSCRESHPVSLTKSRPSSRNRTCILAQRRNRTHVYRLQVGSIPTMLAGHGPLRGLVAPESIDTTQANCVRAFGIHQSFPFKITGASEGSGDFNFLGLPPFFPFSALAFLFLSDLDNPPSLPASRVSMVVLYTYRLRLSSIIYYLRSLAFHCPRGSLLGVDSLHLARNTTA